MNKEILISGMRPTGRLHIGHLKGAIENWIKFQEDQKYSCFFFVADWHALTTKYLNTKDLQKDTFDMVLDWMSIGLDPEKITIFCQSMVKAHSELFLILSMITSLSWLYRCPTYKDMIKELKNVDIHTIGFLGYPVLMSADIMLYKASYVPVGEDQLPHLEFTRELVRKFNYIYNTDFFIEPKAILTKNPKLLGTDGRKMSKSYNNSIYLTDTDEEIKTKIKSVITDPARIHKTDPGHPEICNLYSMQKVFNEIESEKICLNCKKGKIGCMECKKLLFLKLQSILYPIREKRSELEKNKKNILDILENGSKIANQIATENMEKVRKIVKIF